MPFWSRFPVYVSAEEKRARAAKAIAQLTKQAGRNGRKPEPVTIEGRHIAATFWGKAWCENLHAYADLAHRLDRGRTYVRSGAVVDLHIQPARIDARVSGSELYEVSIAIAPLDRRHWKDLARSCAGQLSSLVGLLAGELPPEVMHAVTDPARGLFPKPTQLDMTCSCPDRANVCKHVAASLYAIGARLDARPELLFHLRQVDPKDLLEQVADDVASPTTNVANVLDPGADLAALFGIDLGGTTPAAKRPRAGKPPAKPPRKPKPKRRRSA